MAIPIRIRRPAPISGLRTAWPADALQDTEAAAAVNVRFRFGRVQSAPGRSLLAGPIANEAVLHLGSFTTTDGSKEWAFALTETRWARWGDTTPGSPAQWSLVTGSGLTGTSRYSVTAGEDYVFAARASHPVKRWIGVGATAYESIPDGGTFPGANPPQAKFAVYTNDRLVLLRTTEDGTEYGNRIRWPVNGTHTDWTGNGSGFLDLFEGGGEIITGAAALGGRVVVYHPHAMTELIPTGSLAPVFATETRVRGIGCAAGYTIASSGQAHFFLGTDANVYQWDGTQLVAIGDAILDTLRNLIYPDQAAGYFGLVSTQRQEYWLVLGAGNVFVYDYARRAWSRDTFGNLSALGEVTETHAAILWSTWPSTWAAERRSWAELGGTSTLQLWGGRTDGATFVVDETVTTDYFTVGSIMEAYVETGDWYFPSDPQVAEGDPWREATLQRMLLVYDYVTDEPFEVAVSFDRGQSWSTQIVTPASTGLSIVEWNLTGMQCRFRFRNTRAAGRFRWRQYAYEFVPGGQTLA